MGKTLALLSHGTQQQQGSGRLPELVLQGVQLSDVESVGAAQGFFGRVLAQVGVVKQIRLAWCNTHKCLHTITAHLRFIERILTHLHTHMHAGEQHE